MKSVLPALFAGFLLFACSDNEPDADAGAADATPGAGAPSRPTATLEPEDIEAAQLSGELACSFAAGDSGPVLIARADVLDTAQAEGLVKLGPSAVRLRSEGMGGYNALVHGARFTGGDLRAQVTVTSEEPLGSGESPAYPAELEIGTASLAPQRIIGTWTCGP